MDGRGGAGGPDGGELAQSEGAGDAPARRTPSPAPYAAGGDQHYVFVPGRVCLFGEHSDWAGGFRRFNPDIPVGCTLVVGTNQGLHAGVRYAASAEQGTDPYPAHLLLADYCEML